MELLSDLHVNLLHGHCLCHIEIGTILSQLGLGSEVRGQGLDGEISFSIRDQVLVKLGLITSLLETNHCSKIKQVQQALCSSENLEHLLSMLSSTDQLVAHSASRCLEALLLLSAKVEKDKVEVLLRQAIKSMLHDGGESEQKVSSAINRTIFTLDLMSNMLREVSVKSGKTNEDSPTLPCMGVSTSATNEGSRPSRQTGDDLTIWYHNFIMESILELCAVFSYQFDVASNAHHVGEHKLSSISWLHPLNIAFKHKIYHAFLRLLFSFTKEQMGRKNDPYSILPFIQSVLPHMQAVRLTYCHGSIANLKIVLSVLIMSLQACVKASVSVKHGTVEASDIGLLQSLHASWSGLVADICDDRWLEQMPYHKGPVGFGGFTFATEEVQERSSKEYIRGDIVILRKLAQLVLLGTELGVSSGMDLRHAARHLDRMSHFVVSKLREASLQEEETMNQGRWVFEIFGDQDDTLIEIMLILLKIDLSAQTHLDEESKESSKSESRGEPEDVGDHANKVPAEKSGCILDAHHIFISFLDHMSLDNSILLDLLISTETEFLEYFIRYLRFVTTDWQGFVLAQKSFRRKEEDKDNELCEVPPRVNANGDDANYDDDDVSDGCSNIDEDIDEARFSQDDESDNTLHDHIENDVSRNKIGADKNDLCGQTGSGSLPKSSENLPIKRKCDLEEVNENAARRIKKTQDLLKVTLPLDTKQASHEDLSVNDPSASEFGCLDDTMTILIRLRLAIERLDRKNLFPFLAAPLIRILVKVEDMYEAMDE